MTASTRFHRFSQSSLNRPVITQAPPDSGSTDPGAADPLGQRQRDAIVGQQTGIRIRATIQRLDILSRPSAIFWAIGAVVVDAIDAVLRRRTHPHVGVEVLEGLPPVTDGDAAPAVMREVLMPWRKATSTHPDPDLVFGYRFREPMRRGISFRGFNLPAAARLRVTGREAITSNCDDSSAVACADPLRLSVGASLLTESEHGEAPEPSADERNNGTLTGHRDVSLTRNRDVTRRPSDSRFGALLRPQFYQIGGY